MDKPEVQVAEDEEQPITVELEEDDPQEDVVVAAEEDDKPEIKDGDAKDMASQIEALKLANAQELEREAQKRIEAEQIAARAVQYAQETEGKAYNEYRQRTQTEHDMAQSALAAAQAEQAAAKQAHKIAFEMQDADAVAEAAARIGRSASDIRQAEQAVAYISQQQQQDAYYAQQAAEQRTAQAQQPRQQPQRPAKTPDELLTDMRNSTVLMPQEKQFLNKHPELITDRAKNQALDQVFRVATNVRGLIRGTPEYFEFLENMMGYQPERKQSMGARVSAPVSREGSSNRPKEVKLTERDVEIANSMGLKSKEDLQAYARNKLRIQSQGAN